MRQKAKGQFICGIVLLVVFAVFTASLTVVDVRPIGPKGSCVAYAELNKTVHEHFGVNMALYHMTDWAGVAAILVAFGFAGLGLLQWIKRKRIQAVDSSILALGMYYILVFGVFVFFEFYVINRRPVLINGVLEASYPSSTTMLAMCVLPTAMIQLRRLITNRRLIGAINLVCGLFTAFMVIGRLASGVHWFTDILGGAIFSAGMNLLYCAAVNYLDHTKADK